MRRACNTSAITTLFLTLLQVANAGTLVEMRDETGGVSTLKFEGDKLNLSSDAERDGYMLMDLKNKKMYSISHSQRMIMEVAAATGAAEAATPPKKSKSRVDFIRQGSGPSVAGFATTQYRVVVGDKHCEDVFLAESLLQDKQIMGYFAAMNDMSEGDDTMLEFSRDACDIVDLVAVDHFKKLGIPMKSVSPAGTVTHEITTIKKDVDFSADLFEKPAGYQEMNVADMMQLMQQQMMNMQEPR